AYVPIRPAAFAAGHLPQRVGKGKPAPSPASGEWLGTCPHPAGRFRGGPPSPASGEGKAGTLSGEWGVVRHMSPSGRPLSRRATFPSEWGRESRHPLRRVGSG